MYVQYFVKKVENFAIQKLFTLINNISYFNADYIYYFCNDKLIINLKIIVMNFQTFTLDAQPWMREVCLELFTKDVFSPLSSFDFLKEYDLDGNLVVGFSIDHPFLSMTDLVYMNEICSKHGCFYIIRPSKFYSLSVRFYLKNNQ